MRLRLLLPLCLEILVMSGCADPTPRRYRVETPRAPDTNVYFYPASGQAISAAQQDRDKYECNDWAVQQTGFDPSKPNLPPHQRMQIVGRGPTDGAAVVGGAATGAVLGAAVAGHSDTGRGALLGLLFGAAIGGVADAERHDQTETLQAQSDAKYNRALNARLEREAAQFRRAISACLSARGYSVS